MSLVYAGVCSHAPGITGRIDRVAPEVRAQMAEGYARMRDDIKALNVDALIVIAAEHFANFFFNNMPVFAVGMADQYHGPIEDPEWLKIERTRVPGNAELSRRLITELMKTIDVAVCEEWQFDHGIMVPVHLLTPGYDVPIIPMNLNCQAPPLTPLARAWTFGEELRRACDALPERIALVGTGGISHWPATPDSGRINWDWDRKFMDEWTRNDKAAMLGYTDEQIYEEAGQGGFEIRTFISVAAAAGGQGHVHLCTPVPPVAVSVTVASMDIV
ncbi:MAG: extradiol ring-cleavage dioxygenase [Pigmentiphaga sp.]|nr:extradiol ring-cleavage dioxygenase [Pigmentiphaga sp.]